MTPALLPSADRLSRTEFIPFAVGAAIADAPESNEGADVLLALRPDDVGVPADHDLVREQTCSSLCRSGIPTSDWSLDELYARAEHESRHIGASKRCSSRYWCFGKAMLLVQQQVPEGCWQAWCLEKHIQRDRWKRGRLLALAFSSPDDVADLTIDEATELARELLGLPRRQTAADARLRRSLTLMAKSLQKRLDDISDITNTSGILSRIDDVRLKLNAIDHACAAIKQRLHSHGIEPRRAKRSK